MDLYLNNYRENKIMKKTIVQRRYYSTNDFVTANRLEYQAIKLFGENWEAEDDVYQIEQLLEEIGLDFFEVTFFEGVNAGGYDLQVGFNSNLKRIADLEKASMELFDMVHQGNLIDLKVKANDLYDIIKKEE